jgi:two-component system chemotaxis sensor kinase CheA
MLVSIVSRLGYEVVEAVDGAEALRAAERAVPDLVMTDLDMPVMDGFELIERLRSAPGLSEVPIIVMSTRGAEADKRRAMEAGANAYVVKTEFEEVALQRTFELYLREG